jgi:hypothetical protein
MKRGLLCAIAGALLLGALSQGETRVNAQSGPTGPLSFFKNFFITGDYVTGAVGLEGQGVNGKATGQISISGVPAGNDIVAAYLYWQVVTKQSDGSDSGSVGATFNGYPLSTPAGPFAKALGNGTSPCWSGGGGTGQGSEKQTFTYRADVLRFLPIGSDGEVVANGSHTVQIPDGGSGNSTPLALGATLLLVYRDTSKPLTAVVIYDGSSTINNATQTLTQSIAGHYQPAAVPDARITYIAGAGQGNKNETVSFNGASLAVSPFAGSAGAAWDTLNYNVNPGTGSSVTTSISTAGQSAGDCITFGAIVFKTAVPDTDGDGLLDPWETATASAPVLDPNGQPLPPLADMGANPLRKNIFVEIGYMFTDTDVPYGGVLKPAHSHLPDHETIKLIGDMYWYAPVTNPDGSVGISLHVDAGAGYPSGIADGYIVPRHLARGGESINETVTTECQRGPLDPPWVCQWDDFAGTVGWKTGVNFIKNEILSGEPPPGPGQEDVCDLPGNTCVRRFDRNRKDIFRYAFFAHFAGIPVAEKPCINALGQPDDANPATGHCPVAENANFRVPRTITGIGDFPGGDMLVTMGGFLSASGLPIGTPFTIASTWAHENGHTLELRHSGEPSTTASPNPNCKPTYLSLMNYLYQLRGLRDDLGRPFMDYSRQVGPTLNEQALQEGVNLGSWQPSGPYRIGWYVPLAGSYLDGQAQPVARHCDGTERLPTEQFVRVDARFANEPIDWNANGVISPTPFTLDINFNGRTTARLPGVPPIEPELLPGSDDWSRVRLDQVGARRSIGGFFVDAQGALRFGPMSLDTGRADMGRADMGRADMGRADMGRADMGLGDLNLGDTGRADMGRADMGRADMGRADMGRGDQGGGDFFRGDPNNPGGELDSVTAGDLANTPPNTFTACVIGVGSCTAPPGSNGQLHDVLTTFEGANVGGHTKFIVYRVPGPVLLPGQTWTKVGEVNSLPIQTPYFVIDGTLLVNGAQYTYFAVAQYPGVTSDPSNFVTITAINGPPTISNIADQSIFMNSSTGPIAFTISDERLGTVTLSGTSTNTTLVPNANIVFGGTGANRTVTVTPALNQVGSATITVTVTDATGGSTSDSFGLTVIPVNYVFTGFLSPLVTAGTVQTPSISGLFNFGKAIPIKWTLTLGGVLVSDLASLQGLVAVPGNWNGTSCAPTGGAPLMLLDPATGRPTGNSEYRFSTGQFIFTWDTSATNRLLCYNLTLTLRDGTPPRVTTIRFR